MCCLSLSVRLLVVLGFSLLWFLGMFLTRLAYCELATVKPFQSMSGKLKSPSMGRGVFLHLTLSWELIFNSLKVVNVSLSWWSIEGSNPGLESKQLSSFSDSK